MSAGRLSRRAGGGPPAAPVRLVHLGLGNFFRAHQAWYTGRSPDAPGWGIAAFGGRGSDLADALSAQDGLYTLVTRAPDGDRTEVVTSVSRAHAASDVGPWLTLLASPDTAAVTITVTEAGYHRGGDGHLDVGHPAVAADLEALRRGDADGARSAPGRLVAGLDARRRAGGAPLALVPCDNVPGNGAMTRRIVREMAERVDPRLAGWIDDSVDVVATVVDRITPRVSDEDRAGVTAATGHDDRAPVVTEPFSEWVLSGRFPLGRPAWESAGARLAGDLTPFEQRKLWLLNGAHSLLAYVGSTLGHTTVLEAVGDEACRRWVELWWDEACGHLGQDGAELARYRAGLLERFTNPRMGDRLSRIAEDGSQKLPIRVVPVLKAERAAGRMPLGAVTILAGWVCHLRGSGPAVRDVRAGEVVPLAAGARAAARVLGFLDAALGGDVELVDAVGQQVRALCPRLA